MSDNGWRRLIAACAHEHARNTRYEQRYHAMIREWAGNMVREGEILPNRDHVSITTDTATPLHKKYAILAAVHDEFDICDYKFDPWKPQTESNPFKGGDTHEFLMFAQYSKLRIYVHQLTDDESREVKAFLSDVAADLLHSVGEPGGGPATTPRWGRTRATLGWLHEHYVAPLIVGIVIVLASIWIGLAL